MKTSSSSTRTIKLSTQKKSIPSISGNKWEEVVGHPCYEITHGFSKPCHDMECKERILLVDEERPLADAFKEGFEVLGGRVTKDEIWPVF
jgi:hypothetical protein